MSFVQEVVFGIQRMMMAVIFSNILSFFISLILWVKRARLEDNLNQALGNRDIEKIKTVL
jgi:hypothetical protein